jgi:hypothetical protein
MLSLRLLTLISLFYVEGLLIAISMVRLLFVLEFLWISQQEYQLLGRRILLVIFLISIILGFLFASLARINQELIRILAAFLFQVSNLCVLLSYLICSFVLRRRRLANISILIGEQNLVKTRHLLRMRSVLIGNTLAMISASSLALQVVQMPLPHIPIEWRRLAELQEKVPSSQREIAIQNFFDINSEFQNFAFKINKLNEANESY